MKISIGRSTKAQCEYVNKGQSKWTFYLFWYSFCISMNQCYLITHHPVLSLVLMFCLLHAFVQIYTSYMQRWMIRQNIKLKLFNDRLEHLTKKHSDEPEILKEKKMDLIFRFKIFPLFTILFLVARLFGSIGLAPIVALSQLMVFFYPSDFASYEIIQISCPNTENNICENTLMFMQMDLFSQFYEQPATSMLVLIGLMLTTGIVKYAFHTKENRKFTLLFDGKLRFIVFSYRTLDWKNPK